MVAVKTNCRVWLQVAGLFFLLLGNMLVGQDANTPPPGPPSPSRATPQSSPGLNSSQQGIKGATTQSAWVFSKLPMANAGAKAAAPSLGSTQVSPSNGAGQTLHLIVGRSLFITTTSRLRRGKWCL